MPTYKNKIAIAYDFDGTLALTNYLKNSMLDILIKKYINKIVAEQELNKLN
jgi:hypothetical protein